MRWIDFVGDDTCLSGVRWHLAKNRNRNPQYNDLFLHFRNAQRNVSLVPQRGTTLVAQASGFCMMMVNLSGTTMVAVEAFNARDDATINA